MSEFSSFTTVVIIAVVTAGTVFAFPGYNLELAREKRHLSVNHTSVEGGFTTEEPIVTNNVMIFEINRTLDEPYLIDDVITRDRDSSDSSEDVRTRDKDSRGSSDDVKTRDGGSSASSDGGKTRDRGSSASNDLSDVSEGSGSIESESEESERRKCARKVVTATTVGVPTARLIEIN